MISGASLATSCTAVLACGDAAPAPVSATAGAATCIRGVGSAAAPTAGAPDAGAPGAIERNPSTAPSAAVTTAAVAMVTICRLVFGGRDAAKVMLAGVLVRTGSGDGSESGMALTTGPVLDTGSGVLAPSGGGAR